MDLNEIISGARDALTVKRVYGDPIERDGLTVIPAALVVGGGGGGGGGDPQGGEGSGGGFMGFSRPVGAFVIGDGRVRWEPAIDVTWLLLGVPKILAVVLRVIVKRRSKRKR